MHSLDALAALLIFRYWQLGNNSEYKNNEVNYIILKLLLRLFSYKLSHGLFNTSYFRQLKMCSIMISAVSQLEYIRQMLSYRT